MAPGQGGRGCFQLLCVSKQLEYYFSVTMGAFSLTVLNNRLCQLKLLSWKSGLSTALRRHINLQELEYPKTTIVTYRADPESILTLWLKTTLQVMALCIAFGPHQTTLTKPNRSLGVGSLYLMIFLRIIPIFVQNWSSYWFQVFSWNQHHLTKVQGRAHAPLEFHQKLRLPVQLRLRTEWALATSEAA